MLVAVAAVVLLMIGVFRGEGAFRLVSALSILALVAAAAVTVWMSPAESRSAFAGMFVSNGYTTFLKVGACSLMLRMLEEPHVVLRDMTLENPIRAIREISHDLTCRRRVRLANGREVSALDIQSEYLRPMFSSLVRGAGILPLSTRPIYR